jgi:AraC-like DNA-binding protein
MVRRNAFVKDIKVFYEESFIKTKLKEHFHNSHEIIYIKEGSADFRVGEKYFNAKKNNLVIISNHESHEVTVTQYPYKRYYILISTDCFRKKLTDPVLTSIFRQRPRGFRHLIEPDETSSTVVEGMFNKLYEESTENKPFSDEAMSAYIMLLLTRLYRIDPGNFPTSESEGCAALISEIQRYIEENCTREITLADTAAAYYTNMYYLSHLFKKHSGFTFKQYLILQRLSKAKELLSDTDENITWTALACGFGNVNHFIRMFKKSEGTTPYQYRKNIQRS